MSGFDQPTGLTVTHHPAEERFDVKAGQWPPILPAKRGGVGDEIMCGRADGVQSSVLVVDDGAACITVNLLVGTIGGLYVPMTIDAAAALARGIFRNIEDLRQLQNRS